MKKLFLSLSVCAMSLSAIAAPNSALLIYQDAEKSTGTMLTDPIQVQSSTLPTPSCGLRDSACIS